MKRVLQSAIIAGSTIALMGTSSAAPTVYTVQAHDGYNAGPIADENQHRENNNQYGVGSEQPSAVYAKTSAGDHYMVIVSMGSYTDESIENAPPAGRIQGLCTSYKLDPYEGPQLERMRYIGDRVGDRRRNFHNPDATALPTGDILVQYGYAPNNHTQVYQKVISPTCEILSEDVLVLAKNNDNCGTAMLGPQVLAVDGPNTFRLSSAQQCNGNGSDDAWGYGSVIEKKEDGTYSIDKYYEVKVENNIDIYRAAVAPHANPDRMLVCGADGNSRPAPNGVKCSFVDTSLNAEGPRLLWRQTFEEREGKIYKMDLMPRSVLDSEGNPTDLFYMPYVEADLTNRNGKEKGKTRVKFTVARITDEGLDKLATPTYNVSTKTDGSHPAMCSTLWGPEKQSRAILLNASITGSGVGQASIISFDEATREIVLEDEFVYADRADSGWLANFYGQNPHTQGRNMLSCLGNVPNPGFGVDGGWLSDVESFLVIPSEGRYTIDGMPEDKNGLYVNFVPAIVHEAQQPPEDEDPPGDEDPGDDVPPSGDDEPGDNDNNGGSVGGTGGCSVTSSSAGLGSLLLLGLAMVFVSRRRRC